VQIVRRGLRVPIFRKRSRVAFIGGKRLAVQFNLRFWRNPRPRAARRGFRCYTMVNDVPVLVEPRSRRIVEVIE